MAEEQYIFGLLKRSASQFRPYRDEENNLRRLTSLHLIAAFIIAPIYCFFVYNSEVPQVYFYLGISYIIAVPVYITLCWIIPFLNDKLIYFFITHLFGMTIVAFRSLYINDFNVLEFFCFYALYTLTIFIIQRWYPAVLYNVLVVALMIYALKNLENPHISLSLAFGLFFIFALSSSLVLYSRQRILNGVEDYSEYLKKIMNNPGSGYVLFDVVNEQFRILDFNNEAAKELNVADPSIETMKKLFESFHEEDQERIRNLKIGNKFVKKFTLYRHKVRRSLEVNIILLSLKNGVYWLARINDVTEEINKREELELNEKRYRNLYYRNKAGVFTIEENSKIVNGNVAFFGMMNETVKVGDRLFTDDQAGDWHFIMESLGEQESIQNYQTQMELKDGTQKTFIFSWYLDNQTGYIEGSVIDLTNIQKASQALKQSEQKYRLIYEESNDAILLLDKDIIIDVNRKAVQLFGLPESELMGRTLFSLSIDQFEETQEVYEAHRRLLTNMRSTKFDWLFDGKNRKIEGEVSLIEIILEDKLYYQCVIHDQTEKNSSLREIEKNRRNLENILENNPEGILIVHNDEVLYKNPEISVILGDRFALNKLFGQEDQIQFNKLYQQHKVSGRHENIQVDLILESGEKQAVDVTMVSTNYEDKNATLMIFKDISVQNTLAKEQLRAELAEETNKKLADEINERIKAEKLVQEQFLRTKAILDSSSNTFLLTLSIDQKITSFNTHFQNYFYHLYGREIVPGTHFDEQFQKALSPTKLRYFRIIFSQIKLGGSHQFEVTLNNESREVWLEIFINPIFDTEGNVAEISMVAHDISEKKKTNNEIVESLKEKEVLLKEIHHRVKNNLQVISSILNLQSSFVTDQNTLGILQESRNRIRSMAIIHENLYRTEDFSNVNFSDYLQNLTGNLIASYRINDVVHLKAELQSINLILDQAIPCGLLVNELITNSLKYAWDPGVEGTITLKLEQHDGRVHLLVADNGVGLPKKFEEMNSDTLGLQLVVTLIEQLDGELIVNSEEGTEYLIKFDNIKAFP